MNLFELDCLSDNPVRHCNKAVAIKMRKKKKEFSGRPIVVFIIIIDFLMNELYCEARQILFHDPGRFCVGINISNIDDNK